jgi:hypothetical protein
MTTITREELEASNGASIIGFIQNDPLPNNNIGPIARTVEDKLRERVSVTDWGNGHAAIQAALDEAPLGSTIFFPPGVYQTTGLLMTRQLSWRFDPGAVLYGVGLAAANPLKPILDIRIRKKEEEEEEDPGIGSYIYFDGVVIGLAKDGGGDNFDAAATVNIESQDEIDAPLVGLMWRGGFIDGRDDQTGPALRIAGLTTQNHMFIGANIQNQVHLDGCSDACRFVYNNVFGIKTGFLVDLQVGAFRTLIAHNVITSRDGAMTVIGGNRVDFLYNQVEQGVVEPPLRLSNVNANEEQASVILDASNFRLREINIIGNNFGGGANVERSLSMKTDGGETTIEGVNIERNTWGVTNSGVDIEIKDDGVKYTHITADQSLRGERGGGGFTTFPAYAANTLDVNTLLNVVDEGLGTSMIRKEATELGGASTTMLVNGWTCAAALRFWKDSDGFVNFLAYAVAPAAAQTDVQIGALPEGFRPAALETFVLLGSDNLTGAKIPVYCGITEAGLIVMTKGATTNTALVGMTPVRFIAKRESYDPGY